ncbi:MAG: hypothetical protein ACN4GZ_03235, partial [Acidimicrobiales bacterium]
MSRTRSVVVVIAAVMLFASACSGQDVSDTTASTTTAPIDTTTSTTVVEIEPQSLAWSEVFDVPEPYMVDTIVSAHDRFYALAQDHEAGYDATSMMWTSDDGTEWAAADMNVFGTDATVRELVGSEQGVLAIGFVPAGTGHAATAWFSADGVDWVASDLGYLVEPATQPYTSNMLWFEAAAVGQGGGAVVIARAAPTLDWTAAQQAAWKALPDEFAKVGLDRVTTTPQTVSVTVGPFSVFSESLASLGLDDVQDAQRRTNRPPEAAPFLFITEDLDNWVVDDGNPMSAEYVPAIVTVDDEYVALANSMAGSVGVHTSRDGQTWENHGELGDWAELFKIGDRLIAYGWRGSQPVLQVSDDAGRTWHDLSGPDVSGSWIRAAGPAGVLATGTEGEIGWGATPEPSIIERDGYTIIFDPAAEEFTVAAADATVLVSAELRLDDPMWGWGYTAPDELTFDFTSETVAVTDPTTGDTLVTLTFDDLDGLQSGMVDYGGDLLLFSGDLEQWTVTPMVEAFGKSSMLTATCVGEDKVVSAVASLPVFPGLPHDQSIWMGIPVIGDATPTTQPVDAAPEVAMDGPAPGWERVTDLEGQDVNSIVATDSGVWAVVGDPDDPNELWFSPDGTSWSELDTAALLGEGASIDTLVSGGPGLVAVGFRPADGTKEAVAWTSTDGEVWTVSPLGYVLPTPERPAEVVGLQILEVAAGPSGAVIAASVWEGFDHDRLEPNVAGALPEALQPFATGMGVMIDPWHVSVSVGPFQVFSETVDNLDVDQDLFDAYGRATSGAGPDLMFFATDDFETWQQADDWPGGDNHISALVATSEGYLADTWAWGTGDGPYQSTDGLVWEETELAANHGTIHWFGTHDGRVLMLAEPDGTLWESDDDGTTWTTFAALPSDAYELRAGGMGLVAWGEHDSGWWDPTNWAPTVIDSGGFTLTATSGNDGLSVTDASGTPVVTANLYGEPGPGGFALPPFIEVDHDRGLFTITDPANGDTLMTITYSEMQVAYDDAQGSAGIGPDTFV